MSLVYPLSTTPSGDLMLNSSPNESIASRIRLFLDVVPGDRPMLPEYGSMIQPYMPAEYDVLQAESLRLGLDRWCKGNDEPLTFIVTARPSELGTARLEVGFAIDK